ncbi:MAG: hypothetical protein R3B70_34625 [Polyangiaceae bacterium]
MKARSLVRLLSAVCFVVPVAIAGQSSEAVACGESIAFEVDPNVLLLSQAEGALQTGQPRAAALAAIKVFPTIKSLKPGAAPLLPRAQRIVAMAIVQTDGLLNDGKVFSASTADERRANLEWAIGTLRRLSIAKKNNPAAQTDLGEALARLPETQSEALGTLEKLARKDLVTSAGGYEALAKLRKAAGDDDGYALAMKKVEALTKKRRPAGPAAPVIAKPKNGIFST